MRQAAAYKAAGYRTGDKSNASKLDREEAIRERIEELMREQEQRERLVRGDANGSHTELMLQTAMKAIAAGQYGPAGQMLAKLADAAGELAALNPANTEKPSREEMLRRARDLGPLMNAAAKSVVAWDSFERPPESDEDLQEIARGLSQGVVRLHDLAELLAARAGRLPV
jgi:hypothetical protein